MKWWGWGDPNRQFEIHDKPYFWPFVIDAIDLIPDVHLVSNPPIAYESIQLPKSKRNELFLSKIRLPLLFSDSERLLHAYGKSFRDLWRVRNGIVERAPDCVYYPENEKEVIDLLNAAYECNVVVIPFGGGTNIAGCLEARDEENRMIVSLDMRKMNRLLDVDCVSQIAKVEPGILGPDLEKQLNAYGMTLGHFPDSFQYSTLGGWVATRSAGMQSDKYGKIEDMILSLRLITPQGKVSMRTIPKASNGIDLKHLCIGSEGILGVITEVVVQIHPLKKKKYGSYLFANFEQGISAIQECAVKGCTPSMTRLNDPAKTALSFAFKSKESKTGRFIGKIIKWYLRKVKKFDLKKTSLLLVCFEDSEEQKKMAESIYKKHNAVSLGQDPGIAFEKGKYDFPYIRDFGMDRGITADVSETSTLWSQLLFLYQKSQAAITQAIEKWGVKSFCGCHISHTYHTGASLYFTFACKQVKGSELEQYLSIKKAAEDAFMQNGGTFSHHHGVGFEHQPWMKEEFSELGIQSLQALKTILDPKKMMNPDKLIPTEKSLQVWHEK